MHAEIWRHSPHPRERSDVTKPAALLNRFSFSLRTRPVQHLVSVLVALTAQSTEKPYVEFGGGKRGTKGTE